MREARLAAAVDHPHVVSVFDVGDRDGQLFLAMQWIDGQDLKRILQQSGRLAPERAVAITTQLAGALDAVHSVAGLIHRDVKPANVLIRQMDGTDHAYLTDFGVARPFETTEQLTQTGWQVGTVGYLSPEQIRGGEPGPASDLYALGCLFFETLTGAPPFTAENEMGLRWSHANDPRPRPSSLVPDLGSRYDGFVAKALALDPAERFRSGRELAEALRAAHEGQVVADARTMVVPTHQPTAVGPPTPIPPPAAPAYPAYGYVTPPPGYPTQSKSGNPVALILLGLVALAGIAVGALAAAGVFSHGTTTQTITSARHTLPSKPGHRGGSPGRPAPKSGSGGGTSSCGGDLSVGPATTCGFAQNVEQAYLQSSGGDTSVTASSPATGQTYVMHCTGGSPHVCTGGNNASVYFTSSPSSTPTPSPPSGGGTRPCDQNISANSATSCPFAENVFRAYAQDYQANGEQSDAVVSAYSPDRGQAYTMNCSTDSVTVNCSGGNNAFVTFPMHAVQVY